jgi:hypothetical protein
VLLLSKFASAGTDVALIKEQQFVRQFLLGSLATILYNYPYLVEVVRKE